MPEFAPVTSAHFPSRSRTIYPLEVILNRDVIHLVFNAVYPDPRSGPHHRESGSQEFAIFIELLKESKSPDFSWQHCEEG
jgi:hypothetical protein